MLLDRSLVRLAAAICCAAAVVPAQEVVRTFVVRSGGRTVGSVVEKEVATTEMGRDVVRFTTESLVRVEVLDTPIDQRVRQTWILDPQTRAVLRLESERRAGDQTVKLAGRLVDSGFQLEDGTTLDPARVVIAADFRWLRERGPQQPGERVELDVLMPELAGVHPTIVALPASPDREFEVLGRTVAVREYGFAVPTQGIERKVFVTADGEWLRYELPRQDMVLERVADDAVGALDRVDMTRLILVRTNLDVSDPSPIEWAKLRATIDTGAQVTAESLNVGGQTFVGTVEDGRVEGVFEIRTQRADPAASPAYPPPADAFAAEWLRPFLQPTPGTIESDDPAIAAKARELAEGSATCLEVVERLARWCHREIPYRIPGGGSAKGTFAAREGECGGHSRLLAAMLRSLGIPARTPMGGTYTPRDGGSFGQHMWNEVWLGETIGWLPVDCTAGQLTHVDALHIRLADGEVAFQPQAIEVLDHAPKDDAIEAGRDVVRRTDAYPMLVGEPLVYLWFRGGQELGDERVTYRTTQQGGHVFESSLRLANGGYAQTTRSEVGADGRLIAFSAERQQGPQTLTFEVTAADGKAVLVRKTAGEERNETTTIEPDAFVLHNDCTAHFLVPVSRYAPLADGAAVRVRTLHTEHGTMLSMTLRGGGSETIRLGGTEVRAHVVLVELGGLSITLHVDDRGRLLRFHQQQGDVRIELQRL